MHMNRQIKPVSFHYYLNEQCHVIWWELLTLSQRVWLMECLYVRVCPECQGTVRGAEPVGNALHMRTNEKKIMQNPCFPAPAFEWQQQIVLHASNTYVKPCTRSVHNSAQFSKQNVSCVHKHLLAAPPGSDDYYTSS